MTTDPPIPPALAAFCDDLLKQARRIVADNREVETFALVVNSATGIHELIDMAAANERDKDLAALAVRLCAELHAADAVILMSEAWSLSAQDAPHYQAIYKQYGSLEAYPGHLEILMLSVETLDRTWLGQAPIERQARVKRIGPVTFTSMSAKDGGNYDGRFANFLRH